MGLIRECICLYPTTRKNPPCYLARGIEVNAVKENDKTVISQQYHL